MYGFECKKKLARGNCTDKRCLYPDICPALKVDHGPQLSLLRRLRQIKGVKNLFVASGLRYDMILADETHGVPYLEDVITHHTSGQMKIAPEHTEEHVLRRMGKPGKKILLQFRDLFNKLTQKAGKKQFLTYYMIAAHPGCAERDMHDLKRFAGRQLKINPEQVQVFTPTPSTYSSLMYYTEMDPFTGKKLFVEKDLAKKARQKKVLAKK
jgi:uncharacterized radical SAM protein YgiQ